jgi:hypothetical protein
MRFPGASFFLLWQRRNPAAPQAQCEATHEAPPDRLRPRPCAFRKCPDLARSLRPPIGNRLRIRRPQTQRLDPTQFAGHSGRAGFLTSAAKRGASIFKMMEVSRHRSVDTLRGLCPRCGDLQGSCWC